MRVIVFILNAVIQLVTAAVGVLIIIAVFIAAVIITSAMHGDR